MTTFEKVAAWGLLVAAVVFLALAASSSGSSQVKVSAELVAGDTDDDTRPHICPAKTIPDALRRRHPLYCHRQIPRENGTALMQRGWGAWVLDPPSEEEPF